MGTKTKVVGVGSSIVNREGVCQGGNQVSLGNMMDIISTTSTHPSLAVSSVFDWSHVKQTHGVHTILLPA